MSEGIGSGRVSHPDKAPTSSTPSSQSFSRSREETSGPCIQRASKKRFLSANPLNALGNACHEPPPHQLCRSIICCFCSDRVAVGVFAGRLGGITRSKTLPSRVLPVAVGWAQLL